MVTYRDLFNALKKMPEERLDDTISIYDAEEDEFYSADELKTAEVTDVLDKGHVYLTIKQVLRRRIQDIKKGDFFMASGEVREATEDAHKNFDEKDEPWIVYDTEGNSWFDEDIEG